MGMVSTTGPMAVILKETGLRTKYQVSAPILGKTAVNMKVTGFKTICMAKENTTGQTADPTRGLM